MGNSAVNGSTDILLSYGLPGVIIIGLVIAIVYLQRKLDKKDTTIEELQKLRVDDAKEITTKLKEPLAEQAELSKRIYEILLTDGRRSS